MARRKTEPESGSKRGGDGHRLLADRRAVTTGLTYVLTIAITTVLVSGLIVAAGDTVTRERERAATEELGVVGERLATEMVGVDRLVGSGADSQVELRAEYPRTVVGEQYRIRLYNRSGPCPTGQCLRLTLPEPETETVVPFRTRTPVGNATVAGGPVTVRYDPPTGRLQLEAAS